MNPPSLDHLSERERILMTLHALGELSPAEALEWRELSAVRPELESLANQWKTLAGKMVADGISSKMPDIPEAILKQLEEARQTHAPEFSGRAKHTWLPLALVGLPIAAMVALGFVFLQSHQSHKVDNSTLAAKNGPVAFPEGELVWLAPDVETSQSRPVFIWNGTPGKTYDLLLGNSVGEPFFRSGGVQSPVRLETMSAENTSAEDLSPGLYRITISDPQGKAVATREFTVKEGASTPGTDVPSDQLLALIRSLSDQGGKADALMLLMRVPEDALSIEDFKAWRKKLE